MVCVQGAAPDSWEVEHCEGTRNEVLTVQEKGLGRKGLGRCLPPTIGSHPRWCRCPTEKAQPMSTLEDLADRVERLLLRHSELKRTNGLLEQQLAALAHERDSLKLRLNAARSRVDALLDRLPQGAPLDQGGEVDKDIATAAQEPGKP